MSEIGVNPPIPFLIGMGKGVKENLSQDAKLIQLGLIRPKTGMSIWQVFSVGKLGEGHAKKLISAGKDDYIAIAVVLIDEFSKLVCGDKSHQLGKDFFSRNSYVASLFLSIH